MKTRTFKIIICIFIGIVIGVFSGALMYNYAENKLMGDYDLYNCIYNNAERNRFNQHPEMIKKIQEECICFRDNNYTNLLEASCGGYYTRNDTTKDIENEM